MGKSLSTGSFRLLWLGLLMILPKAGFGNEANLQLLATSEEHRRAAFQVLIAGVGDRCDSIRRTFFQEERPNGEAIWSVECDSDSYNVVVAPDGKTKLISCGELMRLEGRECFRPM